MNSALAGAAGEDEDPNCAERLTFAQRSQRELVAARTAALRVAAQLSRLPANASPLALAEVADRLVSAAGEVWRHAHRVAESRNS
jgi:hypothetical protein